MSSKARYRVEVVEDSEDEEEQEEVPSGKIKQVNAAMEERFSKNMGKNSTIQKKVILLRIAKVSIA